ncbi:MAG: HDOD domain-containing protein [Burkholderiales bacterium]
MDKRQALQTIATEAAGGKLVFPSQVKVALRVREVLDDPDCHVDAVARLVKADPVLSARVVAMANSAINPQGKAITDVRSAITRIGLVTMRTLAAAEVARQMAGMSARPQDRVLATQLWTHTVHMAALAHVLAKRVTKQNAETAMFAGIVHELGGLYLLSRAQDFPCLLESEPVEQASGAEQDDGDAEGPNEGEGEGDVGRAVLRALSVPQPVLTAIEDLWKGYLAMPPTTLGDTLLLADELAPVQSPLRQRLNSERSGKVGEIDMVIGQDMLSDILQESAQDVASLVRALNG